MGSWESAEYVGQWLGEDVIADMLVLPRRISLALVEDAGIDVTHVVDLGSGHGPYLAEWLEACPQARGTWVDVSEPMQAEAREQLARFGDRITYVLTDVEELASAGIDLLALRELMGHANPETTAAYVHLSPETLAAEYARARAAAR